jgi:hypothetical protein
MLGWPPQNVLHLPLRLDSFGDGLSSATEPPFGSTHVGVAEGGGRGDPMGCGQMLEDLEVSSHLLEHIIHIHIIYI